MMRSLFSGVSGLRNTQVAMDVVGNNISNANTLGYKSVRTTFQESFYQTLRGSARPQEGRGGLNPTQVGSGVRVGSTDTIFSQGSFETTGIGTDLAIQGESFFAVSDGSARFYTRAGNFTADSDGRLVTPGNGFTLQGRMAVNGQLVDGVTDIKLPFGTKSPAKVTSNVVLAGNLNASAPTFTGDINNAADRDNPDNRGAWTDSSITVYDSLGAKHELKVRMWKTADNTWQWQLEDGALDATGATGGGTFEFGSDGLLTSPGGTIAFTPNNGAEPVSIELDPGSGTKGLTQFASQSTAVFREQDGYPMGQLVDFGIDPTGTIVGTFDNGASIVLAQVALADFNNPGGLNRIGGNLFAASSNSGEPVLGFAGEGSTSNITSGALEMANVDLAQEFTKMIVYQRGFAANGRMISTADEMLQEVVNLKR
jgi:flagellar hook protein FlgE